MARGCTRSDASADYISTTTSVPADTAGFTIAGWVKVDASAVTNGGYMLAVWMVDEIPAFFIRWDIGLGAMTLYPFLDDDELYLTGITEEWIYVAISCVGGGANGMDCFVWDAAGQIINSGTKDLATRSLIGMTIANRAANNASLLGEYAQWRVWDAALSQSELEAELASSTPVRTANLNRAFEDDPTVDVSGNSLPFGQSGMAAVALDWPPNYSPGSIAVNSTTDRIRRTANLPVSTNFSAGTWVKFTSLMATWATAFELQQDGGNYVRAQLNSTDVIFADSGQLEGNPKYAIAADQWYYLGVSCSGTAEGDFLVRLWNANGALLATSIGQTNNFTSAFNMDFGNGVENTYQNAKFAHGRVWDAVLSRAEFEKEMASATPVRTANLNTAFVDSITDISGNARDWTLENVVWDVDTPTLPQNAPRPMSYYYRTLGVT